MEVADVPRVVVAGDGVDGRLNPLAIGQPVLELLPVALVREVAGADHDVGLHLVQLHDHAVHEIGYEHGGTDVWI
jgi:hypothetical protein